MTPKQQKERLRKLRLAEDARDFMTRVVGSPQPPQVLLKYAENTKLRQFLKANLFDSDAIANLHTLLLAFFESDLERLSSHEDICALVFPRTNYQKREKPRPIQLAASAA
jgi:hypothetical protein